MGFSPEVRAARRLARESYVTGTNLEVASKLVFLPEDVNGSIIVDIGAGTDSITAELRALGANAFATDYRYSSLGDIVKNLHPYGANTETLQRFVQDYNYHREGYIAAVVGGERLPFEDKSVRCAFSLKCLSTVVLDDFETFLRAYEEILRVLIPHEDPLQAGALSIHPWTGSIDMSHVNLVHANRFRRHLQEDPRVDFFVARPDPYLTTLVIIRKS